jgi:hypothetical protein
MKKRRLRDFAVYLTKSGRDYEAFQKHTGPFKPDRTLYSQLRFS